MVGTGVALRGDEGGELLRAAAAAGQAAAVRKLLEGADSNGGDDGGGSCSSCAGADGLAALHLAAEAGHVSVVELLLQHGATVDITTPDGDTPLHMAAAHGHTSVVEQLLLAGARPDAPRPRLHGDEAPATALAVAVYNRQLEAAATLVSFGADPYADTGGTGDADADSDAWSHNVMELAEARDGTGQLAAALDRASAGSIGAALRRLGLDPLPFLRAGYRTVAAVAPVGLDELAAVAGCAGGVKEASGRARHGATGCTGKLLKLREVAAKAALREERDKPVHGFEHKLDAKLGHDQPSSDRDDSAKLKKKPRKKKKTKKKKQPKDRTLDFSKGEAFAGYTVSSTGKMGTDPSGSVTYTPKK